MVSGNITIKFSDEQIEELKLYIDNEIAKAKKELFTEIIKKYRDISLRTNSFARVIF